MHRCNRRHIQKSIPCSSRKPWRTSLMLALIFVDACVNLSVFLSSSLVFFSINAMALSYINFTINTRPTSTNNFVDFSLQLFRKNCNLSQLRSSKVGLEENLLLWWLQLSSFKTNILQFLHKYYHALQ